MYTLMHKGTRALSEQKMIRAMKRKNSSRSQEWSWFSMLDNYPDVLSFRQVMEITHVGRNLLLRLLNSGEIPAFKMGKLWKVYKQNLIQYMSQCQWAASFLLVKRIPLDSATGIQRDSILSIFNALVSNFKKDFTLLYFYQICISAPFSSAIWITSSTHRAASSSVAGSYA